MTDAVKKAEPTDPVDTSRRKNVSPVIILITMSLCTMLYALTLTIVSVALPQLQGALSATPDQVSWVVTLNIVATAVATPMTGWFVARFGQRPVLLFSVLGFSFSSLLCGTATALAPLLIYRVGQGLFGAPLVPLAQAIIVAAYPPEKRAAAQGVFGMSVVIGPALAPALGGYLAGEYSWRWVFFLILPLCVAAFVLVYLFIQDTGKQKNMRLDWTGFVTLSIAVTCVQLLLDRGERLDWFDSTEIVLLTAAMTVCFYLFLAHTFTAEKPFISPSLFLDRNFSIGLFLVFVYGMLNVTPTVLLPPMLQNLKGYPDNLIGLLLAMRGMGMVFGFMAAAMTGRLDPRIGMIIGLSLIGISGWMTMRFDLNVPAYDVAIAGIIQGFGSGLMWVPLSVVTFATLNPRLLPDASAMFHLLRNFGSSLFISVSVMVVIRGSLVNFSELSGYLSPFNKALFFPSVTGLWNFESLNSLSTLSGEINRQATMIGYLNAFTLYTAVCVLTIPLMLLVKIKQRPH